MGLMIHSLAELPANVERGYFIYLLDYGWKNPVNDTLHANLEKMGELASKHNAVILRGTVGSHFEDEVLSWHHINGLPAESILPALLITRMHPALFRDHGNKGHYTEDNRLVLIPLGEICKSPSDATPIITQLFQDILEKKNLSQFKIQKQFKPHESGALSDTLILQPNISGVGVDVKKLWSFMRGKLKR